MFRFKGFLFNNFFTDFDKRTDPNKDADGKGTVERYQEIFEEEYDDTILPKVETLQRHVISPRHMLDRYIPYGEDTKGYLPEHWPWFAAQSIQIRRNILMIMPSLYKIRGTIRAYNIMFAWVGLTATIEEIDPIGGAFDLPDHTWDMPGRTFDADCPTCSKFKIHLTGPNEELTPDQMAAIETILEYNTPMGAILDGITYNESGTTGDFNNDFAYEMGEDFY